MRQEASPCPSPSSPSSAAPASSAATSPSAWPAPAGGCASRCGGPNEAGFVRPYGAVGQVEPIQANIRDEASTRRAIAGADAVVNCVGILVESRQADLRGAAATRAPARIARIAAEEGVARLVHISAIGADPGEREPLRQRQGQGRGGGARGLPRRGDPAAVDRLRRRGRLLQPLRPHGAAVARCCRWSAPETRFQPVYVDDVAAAAAAGRHRRARRRASTSSAARRSRPSAS